MTKQGAYEIVAGVADRMTSRDPFIAFILMALSALVGWYVYSFEAHHAKMIDQQMLIVSSLQEAAVAIGEYNDERRTVARELETLTRANLEVASGLSAISAMAVTGASADRAILIILRSLVEGGDPSCRALIDQELSSMIERRNGKGPS